MKKLLVIILIIICVVSAMGVFSFVLFPKKYTNEIKQYSKEFSLSESMVASIINIESGYACDAISDAGAMGLMQLLPTTAFDCANRLNIDIEESDIFESECNIRLGCFYMRYLLDLFDENLINALCAYNWGYGNVCNWINNGNVDDEGTITNIPIKETQNYIRKFKVCKFIYKKLYRYN